MGMWRLRTALCAVCVLHGIWLTPRADAASIEIRDIHVTQGVQTVRWAPGNERNFPPQDGNAVPLVAGRSTAVRVLLGVNFDPGEAREPTPPVFRGTLEVFVASQSVGVFIADNEPIRIPVDPKIDLIFHTLNFTIPPGILRFPGPDWERSVAEFHVTIGAGRRGVGGSGGVIEYVTEGRADSPDERFEGLLVLRHPRVTVLAEAIEYPPFTAGLPVQLDLIQPGTGDAFLLAALPIDDSCAPTPADCPYRLMSGFTYSTDINGNGLIDLDIDPAPDVIDTRELREVLSTLAARRSMYVLDGDPAGRWTFLYGWLPSGSTSGAFGFTGAGKVAAGIDWPEDGQATLAHEIGHQFGLVHLPHAYCGAAAATIEPNLGWDVMDRLAFNPSAQLTPPGWPGNRVTGPIKLPEWKHLMNACPPLGMNTAQRWTSVTNYRVISARLRDEDSTWHPIEDGIQMDPACQPGITLSGEVTRFRRDTKDGDETLIPEAAKLLPAFTLPPCRYPTRSYRKTDLYAEVVATDEAGKTEKRRVPIDAYMIVDMGEAHHIPNQKRSSPEHTDLTNQMEVAEFLGPFNVTVPTTGPIESITLKNAAGTKTFARIKRSAAAPEIEVLAPKPGTRLGRASVLEWKVDDRDTAQADLMYHVAYSADGGRNFVPVEVNLRKTRLTFDAANLPVSEGHNGLLRVFVSDGLNSRFADVRGLENAGSRFERVETLSARRATVGKRSTLPESVAESPDEGAQR